MSTTTTERELIQALSRLIDVIDFEGPQGAVHFNPDTPFELGCLQDARAVLAKALAEQAAA